LSTTQTKEFQSHNGAIAARTTLRTLSLPLRFQSHNGAIAAVHGRGYSYCAEQFQSHNGAIAANLFKKQECLLRGVSIPQWCDCCWDAGWVPEASAFVSIPQWCDCCALKRRERIEIVNGFNPTMVRLLLSQEVRWCLIEVSIPQWCDCCWQIRQAKKALDRGFNPTMVRLLLCVASGDANKECVSIPQWCDCC